MGKFSLAKKVKKPNTFATVKSKVRCVLIIKMLKCEGEIKQVYNFQGQTRCVFFKRKERTSKIRFFYHISFEKLKAKENKHIKYA